MSKSIVFEDGILKQNISEDAVWDGLFSRCSKNGSIVTYVQQMLPKNSIFVIPRCDGDICRTMTAQINWYEDIQPHIDDAKKKGKIFLLGTLSQVTIEKDINYIYLPLDDGFFENGTIHYFPDVPLWENKSDTLCWRGGCSGYGKESVRIRFTKKVYEYAPSENVRLSWWWSENKNIPHQYFADRLNYSEFLKYKIFFIVDGNVIASNHMWGFAVGSIPFYISNAKCWFSSLIIPYVHYIPINYDLSNLIEQIEWVRNNDEKAKTIALNAYKFAEIYFSSHYQKQYIKNQFEKY